MAGKKGMNSNKPSRPSDLPRFEAGWLGSVDRRTALYQALTTRLSELYSDLGGLVNLSVQRRIICERIVFLELQVRDIETRALNGDPSVDFGRYGFLANVLTGLQKTIGLDRQAPGLDGVIVRTNGAMQAWQDALAADEEC